MKSKNKGIHGLISTLGNVKSEYSVALEVAAGGRIKSIVVDDDKIAAECIRYLKENKLGIATFMPMNNPNDVPPYVGSILCLAHLMALFGAFEHGRWKLTTRRYRERVLVDGPGLQVRRQIAKIERKFDHSFRTTAPGRADIARLINSSREAVTSVEAADRHPGNREKRNLIGGQRLQWSGVDRNKTPGSFKTCVRASIASC